MKKIRFGYLNYLNATPFYWGRQHLDVTLLSAVPSELGQFAARGQMDAGPMSVADWFKLEEDFEPLGSYGIACSGKAQSVFLLSNEPIQRLNGADFWLTKQSSTSVQLLKVILEQKYGLEANSYQRGDKGLPRLVIGDEALRIRGQAACRYVYDLGEEWWEWKKLPFVFARWVVRRDLAQEDKQRLLGMVRRSFELGMAELDQVALHHAEQAQFLPGEIFDYLSNFTYVLGAEEEKGLQEFKKLATAATQKLWPVAP